jgi:hypothetical protein
MVVDGQQAGGHDHGAAKGEQGSFYRHCHNDNSRVRLEMDIFLAKTAPQANLDEAARCYLLYLVIV